MLKRATKAERNAYEKLVPPDGNWGTNRNRAALLAAYHGRNEPNAAYLLFDDDVAIRQLKETTHKPRLKITHRPPELDALNHLIMGFRLARETGHLGYKADYSGVSAGASSEYTDERKCALKGALNPKREDYPYSP
ncbi:TPA: hypothetical protein HA318_01395 [Candidatus Micrarchaeota archaeon]|nr:MAG: hypothetical protein AUJ65_04350 [Candidatus Micrarchaeota archaeon CG1_02_51_15]HII38640.1 hypothetical protein [Candidatus Micrarchaeota archaeon]